MGPKRKTRREEPCSSPATLPAATTTLSTDLRRDFPEAPMLPSAAALDLSLASASDENVAVSSSASHAPSTHYYKLNVGGKLYMTTRETLLSADSDSLLRAWTLNDFRDLPRTADGHIYINRDGKVFKHILNFLRGYKIHVPQDDIALLAEDLAYYRLTNMMKDTGFCSPEEWAFNQGPGVSKNCRQFHTTTLVALTGEQYRTEGAVMASWKIEKCEIAAIGAVTAEVEADQGTNFKSTPGCVCYINTGELFFNWEAQQVERSLPPGKENDARYREGDIVAIRLDYSDWGAEPSMSNSSSGQATAVPGTDTGAGPEKLSQTGAGEGKDTTALNVSKGASSPSSASSIPSVLVSFVKNDTIVSSVRLIGMRPTPSEPYALPALRPAIFIEGTSVLHLLDIRGHSADEVRTGAISFGANSGPFADSSSPRPPLGLSLGEGSATATATATATASMGGTTQRPSVPGPQR